MCSVPLRALCAVQVSRDEAKHTLDLWYSDRPEVKRWQHEQREEARRTKAVRTLLGRFRHLPGINDRDELKRSHMERAAINAPVQGSAADIAMLAMLQIVRNADLRRLQWKLIMQVRTEDSPPSPKLR